MTRINKMTRINEATPISEVTQISEATRMSETTRISEAIQISEAIRSDIRDDSDKHCRFVVSALVGAFLGVTGACELRACAGRESHGSVTLSSR